jgi:hypothetical protein
MTLIELLFQAVNQLTTAAARTSQLEASQAHSQVMFYICFGLFLFSVGLSGSIFQRYGSGSGSFTFLMKVLSCLKKCLQNKICTQKNF